jgi:hypothetical protein
MFAPRYEFHSFELLPHAARVDVVRMLVKVLIVADRLFLQAHPSTPKLYDAGVRYLREDPDSENYQNIPRTLELRTGDCEDLVAWRLAELQEAGEDAHLVVREWDDKTDVYFHLLVGRPNGDIEDPSALLGM